MFRFIFLFFCFSLLFIGLLAYLVSHNRINYGDQKTVIILGTGIFLALPTTIFCAGFLWFFETFLEGTVDF